MEKNNYEKDFDLFGCTWVGWLRLNRNGED